MYARIYYLSKSMCYLYIYSVRVKSGFSVDRGRAQPVTEMGSCLGYQSEGTVVAAPAQQQRDPLDDYIPLLPKELQGLILGYVRYAFTNESLRTTVTEYFEDVSRVTRSWNVSSVTNMSWMFIHCRSFNQNLRAWDTSSVRSVPPTNWTGADYFLDDEWHNAIRPPVRVADHETPYHRGIAFDPRPRRRTT